MNKLIVLLFLSIGGWIGWALGARWGIMTAYICSVVGSGIGLYVARRIGKSL